MNNLNRYLDSEKGIVILALIGLMIYFSPYIIFGEDTHVLIHDNLDSNISCVKMVLDNGGPFFSPSQEIEQILNGLDASYVYPYYDISLIIFDFFGMYWGYVLNKIVISIIGFFGMYLLLKRQELFPGQVPIITVGVSLLYAILPFWSFTATVSGIPFVVFAFLNLRNNNLKIYNWLIIILFAFYSSIILSGLFLLILLGLLFLYDLKQRNFHWPYLLGMFLLCGLYLISHFPLIYSFIVDKGVISHRVDFYQECTDLWSSIKISLLLFTKGQYHASSLHSFILVPILLVLFKMRRNKLYVSILIFITVTSLFYGFRNSPLLRPIVDVLAGVIPIQLQRFHFLHPMSWYILLAMSLTWIYQNLKFGKLLSVGIILGQLTYLVLFYEVIPQQDTPSFKEFYAVKTFSKVDKIIGKPKRDYKVIALGFHPSILHYNGFYTLDGYVSNYPLKYKHEFKSIIENELDRDGDLKKYFNDWGSRCYALSSELGLDFLNNTPEEIELLKFNINHLKKMGCRYILSSAKINLDKNSGIKLLSPVKGEYWIVNIYEIL